MDPLVYWIWLALRCGAGSESGSLLLSAFDSPRAIYEANEKALRQVKGLDENRFRALSDHSLEKEKMILAYCNHVGVGILTPDHAAYPARLRDIYAKPLVLYYLGTLPDFDDRLLISCVGTRKCSQNGRANAFRLGYDLAAAGAVVVSGMAKGVDTAAHCGAISAGGHTVAVLGCGIDHVYPPENKELMREITKHGTVLTEFAPGCAPTGKNFPIRNRIISGLSQATTVIEADPRSGSLITARRAIQQGRDIFAYPGNASDNLSMGTNTLIRDGATLTTSAFDILQEYELLYPHKIFSERIAGYASHRERALDAFLRGLQIPVAAESSRRKKQHTDEKCMAEETPKKAPVKKQDASRTQTKNVSDTQNACMDPEVKGLSDKERTVISLLDREISCEELAVLYAKQTGKYADISELLSILTMLEMEGYIEALPGGLFHSCLSAM